MNRLEKHIKKFARDIIRKKRLGILIGLELLTFFLAGLYLTVSLIISFVLLLMAFYLALIAGEAIYLKGGIDNGIQKKSKSQSRTSRGRRGRKGRA